MNYVVSNSIKLFNLLETKLNSSSLIAFQNSSNGLTDIPYTGFHDTWSNIREANTLCKLDRIICNSS
uniref:Uncharacterized protein n=1 Tax=Kalanchoe fedtschenkoi TaxID=63787 RepID=A0A7N0RAW4_KALFE